MECNKDVSRCANRDVRIDRGIQMRQLKKISCTIILMFVFLTTNVWASAMGDMLISEKGMQIYVIPAGPQGKQNCDLYA